MSKQEEMVERCSNCIYRFDGWYCDYFKKAKECIKVFRKCITEDVVKKIEKHKDRKWGKPEITCKDKCPLKELKPQKLIWEIDSSGVWQSKIQRFEFNIVNEESYGVAINVYLKMREVHILLPSIISVDIDTIDKAKEYCQEYYNEMFNEMLNTMKGVENEKGKSKMD